MRRRALVIGINDYAVPVGAPGRQRFQNLAGAVRDAEEMREVLMALYGFKPHEIITLTDQAATRAAILRSIEERLVNPAGKGDVVFFYFSGHGSQVRNSRSTEPDRLDESLVPADSWRGAPDIRDKELQPLFNRILDRGARLTVVLDSCHSGSGVRGLPVGARFRSAEPDLRDVLDGSPAGPRPEDRGALVLSAAQDYDLAWEGYDERGRPRGAFSLALVRALRDSVAGEPAEETFLRARARLQAEKRFQEPLLAGNAEARRTPLLGHRTGQRAGRTVVAVERVGRDGTVLLQGGWANGLTLGSELRLLEPGPEVRLAVTAVHGFSRCEARLLPPRQRSEPTAPEPGMLAEVVRFAALPGAPLRVWMPQAATGLEAAVALARELAREAPCQGIAWVEDPTGQTPTHVLRWRGQGWELLAAKGAPEPLGPATDSSAVLAKIPKEKDVALFVQLPSPPALVRGITVGPGTDHSSVEATERPEEADYVLAGRLSAEGPEYAWLRPGAGETDRRRTSLPARTAWHSPQAPDKLESAVLRLHKIRAWLHLETPPGGAFPYELALCRKRGNKDATCSDPVTDGILIGEERYHLFLRARTTQHPAQVAPRYIYIFLLNSDGRSILLFPRSGSVENRSPLPPPAQPASGAPAEMSLDAELLVNEPYGIDTYFLLTSEELIPNPWVLEGEGVRARGPLGQTPLEELLSITGGTVRSATPISTPAVWSIDRGAFESLPPDLAQDR
ncbi:MAG TPA: caspase family protein [Thermoanaerobaculia bacterium]|nr:caspase family protein [Thermoanaerobaculia bacterium]